METASENSSAFIISDGKGINLTDYGVFCKNKKKAGKKPALILIFISARPLP